ncbi:hypothetical protein Tco_0795066 [Tanacetum coccineum]
MEMDYPSITIEEYIKLEAEKARMRGQTFNWETATYGKVRYHEDINYFKDFETNFPAIVYKDALASDHEISSEPTVSTLDDNKIDFKISFDEYDDEDYTQSDSGIDTNVDAHSHEFDENFDTNHDIHCLNMAYPGL